MPLRFLYLALFVFLLSACGSDDASTPATASDPAPGSASDRGQNKPRASAASDLKGHCALISPEEIEAIFPIPLNLGQPKVVGRADNPMHACEVQLGVGEIGRLTFGTTSEGAYNEYARYLQQSSTPSRMIEGLGEEAFLLNNAQLLVRRGDERFLNISMMPLTMGEPPMSQEQGAEAVMQIGTMMDERLP